MDGAGTAYLAAHQAALEASVTSAVAALLRARPSDPHAFLARHFATNSQQAPTAAPAAAAPAATAPLAPPPLAQLEASGNRRPDPRLMATSGYKLCFWTGTKQVVGRAHGPLMCLEQAGFEYELIDTGFPNFSATPSSPSIPEGFPVFCPPILVLPDGTAVSQQIAICATIGKRSGLIPESDSEEAIALSIAGNTSDLFSEMLNGQARGQRLTRWFATYEAALEGAGSGYLVGEGLTYVDLYSYQLIKYHVDHGFAKPPPRLAKWLATMAETKAAKAVTKRWKGMGRAALPRWAVADR